MVCYNNEFDKDTDMTIIKIILVLLLMVGMSAILLGIGQISGEGISSRHTDVDKLRDEVKNSEEVISPRSAFSNLLSACHPRRIRDKL